MIGVSVGMSDSEREVESERKKLTQASVERRRNIMKGVGVILNCSRSWVASREVGRKSKGGVAAGPSKHARRLNRDTDTRTINQFID